MGALPRSGQLADVSPRTFAKAAGSADPRSRLDERNPLDQPRIVVLDVADAGADQHAVMSSAGQVASIASLHLFEEAWYARSRCPMI